MPDDQRSNPVNRTHRLTLDRRATGIERLRRWKLLRDGFSNWRFPAALALVNYRASVVLGTSLPLLPGVRCHLRARSGSGLTARVQDLNAAAEVFGNGEYDLPEIEWDGIDHVLDLGSHVGSFTVWAAERTRARFLAVEPNPATFRLLQRNIRPLADRVAVRQLGVAGSRGRMRLELNNDSAAAHLLSQPEEPDNAGGTWVGTATFADLVRESSFQSVDLVKMDVEGAEYEVLDSLTPAELSAIRYWIVECHPQTGRDVAGLAAAFEGAGHAVRIQPKPGDLALVIAAR